MIAIYAIENSPPPPKKKKKITASMGFKPMAYALALQCSSNWANDEDTYIERRPIFSVYFNWIREWHMKWSHWWSELQKYKIRWRYDCCSVIIWEKIFQVDLQLLKLLLHCDDHTLIEICISAALINHGFISLINLSLLTSRQLVRLLDSLAVFWLKWIEDT